MDIHLVSYYIGIFILFSLAIYKYVKLAYTDSALISTSILCIAYYYMFSEGFIKF